MSAMDTRVGSLQLQDRDFMLLRGLFECRVMTAKHAGVLYFDNKQAYAQKRLQQLKSVGLIAERRRRVNEPSILFLTRKGFRLLRDEGHLHEYPSLSETAFEGRANVSERTLRHELDVMDVKAAFHAALHPKKEFEILKFSTWPRLHEFRISNSFNGREIAVRPDGFIRVEEVAGQNNYIYDAFLEVDRSTEVQDALVDKAVGYLEYHKSGGFAEHNGASRSDGNKFPFRVLMVFKSRERRNNTAARLAQNIPPILRQAWLTTFSEVTADPLGPIWIRPIDFRAATLGTSFFEERPALRSVYRRQMERDNFIEAKIVKRRFFEDDVMAESSTDREEHRAETPWGRNPAGG